MNDGEAARGGAAERLSALVALLGLVAAVVIIAVAAAANWQGLVITFPEGEAEPTAGGGTPEPPFPEGASG